jgi:hypothetical protein
MHRYKLSGVGVASGRLAKRFGKPDWQNSGAFAISHITFSAGQIPLFGSNRATLALLRPK